MMPLAPDRMLDPRAADRDLLLAVGGTEAARALIAAHELRLALRGESDERGDAPESADDGGWPS